MHGHPVHPVVRPLSRPGVLGRQDHPEVVAADVAILARGSEHLARIAADLVSGPG
ncbi:hypothetical protein AB0L44_25045 [Nonomuraea wenchangensis]|uniref:hypothetical protein n=1 Tax=Nonomuraea wenchangensis TaxID=568860 RepID=UPI0034372DBD